MSALQIKTTRWAIASRYREWRTLYWSQHGHHVRPNLYKTRREAREECGHSNLLSAGRVFFPVRVSVVITEIKTKKGKK